MSRFSRNRLNQNFQNLDYGFCKKYSLKNAMKIWIAYPTNTCFKIQIDFQRGCNFKNLVSRSWYFLFFVVTKWFSNAKIKNYKGCLYFSKLIYRFCYDHELDNWKTMGKNKNLKAIISSQNSSKKFCRISKNCVLLTDFELKNFL